METLSFPIRDYGLVKQLKADVAELPCGVGLDYPVFENILVAARRMVRETAFDICEMPVTTYICAKAHGKPFTAIPVFVTRNFHHGAIYYNTDSDIRTPKDLEGRTVAVNRGYTVTTGVWARAVLQTEYGVDLSKVQWSCTDDEHVAEFQLPANADYGFKGRAMGELFESGAVDAAVGAVGGGVGSAGGVPDNVQPLIDNPVAAGFASYRKTGLYPVNHTVVVRDELLAAKPNLAAELFQALTASKAAYMDGLNRSGDLSAEDALTVQLEQGLGGDPFPYGIAPNRKALDTLVQAAIGQTIVPRPYTVEELFAPGTAELTG